jgi:hypothetical protein
MIIAYFDRSASESFEPCGSCDNCLLSAEYRDDDKRDLAMEAFAVMNEIVAVPSNLSSSRLIKNLKLKLNNSRRYI